MIYLGVLILPELRAKYAYCADKIAIKQFKEAAVAKTDFEGRFSREVALMQYGFTVLW